MSSMLEDRKIFKLLNIEKEHAQIVERSLIKLKEDNMCFLILFILKLWDFWNLLDCCERPRKKGAALTNTDI